MSLNLKLASWLQDSGLQFHANGLIISLRKKAQFNNFPSIQEIPPVRNSLYRSKKKNKHKKQKDKTVASNKIPIPATDYKVWDKFDAVSICHYNDY